VLTHIPYFMLNLLRSTYIGNRWLCLLIGLITSSKRDSLIEQIEELNINEDQEEEDYSDRSRGKLKRKFMTSPKEHEYTKKNIGFDEEDDAAEVIPQPLGRGLTGKQEIKEEFKPK
jgi:hypothetical protein